MTKTEFLQLPKNEQRVLLAKDVLAQIEAGKLIDNYSKDRGPCYFEFTARSDVDKDENIGLKEVLDRDDVSCYVCAKGALVASWIKRFNEVKLSRLNEYIGFINMFKWNPDLIDVFGPYYWHRIEQLYETRDPRFAIAKLMQDIIDNNGEPKLA